MPLLSMDYTAEALRFAMNMTAFGQAVELLADNAVRQTMQEVAAQLDATVPVDTGALRSNRSGLASPQHLTWETGYDLPYAAVLEYGGYPGVGPKTETLGGGDLGAGFEATGGIYSKQAPLGWVRKALAASHDAFLERVTTAVREAWTGQLGGRATGEVAPTLGAGGLGALFDIELGG